MRILLRGATEGADTVGFSYEGGRDNACGFILLRDLLMLFIVIISFAVILAAMAVLSSRSSRQIQNTEQETKRRNELVMQRIRQ
ncbi:MAG: hypothetical protein FWF29_12300 [Treponema sp.]|nr:hypothetical protein [Treponema sp.]